MHTMCNNLREDGVLVRADEETRDLGDIAVIK